MNDNIEYGRPIWQRPRSQGKSFIAEAVQKLAEKKAREIERDLVMGEADGGLFVPREFSKEISEVVKHQHFNDWSYQKYNLNKKVLIL